MIVLFNMYIHLLCSYTYTCITLLHCDLVSTNSPTHSNRTTTLQVWLRKFLEWGSANWKIGRVLFLWNWGRLKKEWSFQALSSGKVSGRSWIFTFLPSFADFTLWQSNMVCWKIPPLSSMICSLQQPKKTERQATRDAPAVISLHT